MSFTTGTATTFTQPNYVGELFIADQKNTPFLSMIGGLTGGKEAKGWEFPNSVEESIGSASQPNITETASLTAPTASHVVPSQTTNVCQIYHESVSFSYARQSDNASLSGLSILGTNPIADPYEHQKTLKLMKIARDVEYTFLQGAFQRKAAATTSPEVAEQASKTRGIITAITTNTVAGASGALTKAMINSLVRSMADNGAPFGKPVLFCNSFQKQALTGIYGQSPLGGEVQSRTYGGVAIQTVLTDFCELGIVYDPFMPTDTILVADLAVCNPMFLAVPGKGYLFYEELAKTGAEQKGQFYGQIGLAYGPENFHGKITGLATS